MAARLRCLAQASKKFADLQARKWSIGLGHTQRCIHTSQICLETFPIKMPALSPTMTAGTIKKWYKKEGEAIAAGEVLCDIETDKAIVSMDVDDDGIVAKLLVPDGTPDVQLGTLIAVLVEEGDDWQNVEVPADAGLPSTAGDATASPDVTTATSSPSSHLGYGPAVRSLLDIYCLTVDQVPATGPHGRLLKGDILVYIRDKGLKPAPVAEVALPVSSMAGTAPIAPASSPPAPVTTAAAAPPKLGPPPAAVETEGYTDIELTNMRRTIARRLTESKVTIPHSYGAIDCNMGEVIKMRKQIIADGVKVSVNDFIIKAAAVALKRVPQVNAVFADDAARLLDGVDISVAVATDAGLITPIVKDAAGIGMQEISETVKALAGKARAGKLQPHEFMGGSFTISNLGMFGISHFTAVINPPQACILAIGSSRVVPDVDGNPQSVMTVQLSADARIVDAALASEFLAVFREIMENPWTMLSGSAQQGLRLEQSS